MGHNGANLHSIKVIAIANKLEINVYSGGFSTQFLDVFNLYINLRFILEEINSLLIGKTYINKRLSIHRQRRGENVKRRNLR